MARLDARLSRLAPAVAAEVTRRTEQRRHAFQRWQQTLNRAWSDAPALVARFQAQGMPEAEARTEVRHWLETARWFGVVYYEAGAVVLAAMLHETPVIIAAPDDRDPDGRFTAVEVDALVEWATATWGPGSPHPHAPWLPPGQRLGALDNAPPRPTFAAATAARARQHPQPWDVTAPGERWSPELTPGMVFAELAYRFVYHGEGEEARQTVAHWVAAEAGYDTATATEQAERLAADVPAIRRQVLEEGAMAVIADLVAWGTSAAEAGLVLDYSGTRPTEEPSKGML